MNVERVADDELRFLFADRTFIADHEVRPMTTDITTDPAPPQHWRRFPDGQWHLAEWLGIDAETETLCGRMLPPIRDAEDAYEGQLPVVGRATCNSCLNVFAARVAE